MSSTNSFKMPRRSPKAVITAFVTEIMREADRLDRLDSVTSTKLQVLDVLCRRMGWMILAEKITRLRIAKQFDLAGQSRKSTTSGGG